MKRLIFSLAFFVLLSGCARLSPAVVPLEIGSEQKPLEISGILQKDMRLGGVIRVTADLTVPRGHRLQIEAGSHLLVVGNDSSKIDPEYLDKGTEILVKGQLVIAGTEQAPVSLTLDEATPPGENWAGLEFVQAEGADLSHVDIIGAETGILSLESQLNLSRVNILGSGYGLLLQGGGSLIYDGGQISGGVAGLICFDPMSLKLLQLKIVDNLEEGLYLAKGCSVELQDLLISRNDLGVVASEADRPQLIPLLHDNRVDFRGLPTESQL